jgi:hypothetical protein
MQIFSATEKVGGKSLKPGKKKEEIPATLRN